MQRRKARETGPFGFGDWIVHAFPHGCGERRRRRKDRAPGFLRRRNLKRTDGPTQKQILRSAEESRSTQDDTASTLKPAASAGGDFAFTQDDTASTLEPAKSAGGDFAIDDADPGDVANLPFAEGSLVPAIEASGLFEAG